MKYNNIEEYNEEIKRIERIISKTTNYKVINDLRRYIRKLKKEKNNL